MCLCTDDDSWQSSYRGDTLGLYFFILIFSVPSLEETEPRPPLLCLHGCGGLEQLYAYYTCMYTHVHMACIWTTHCGGVLLDSTIVWSESPPPLQISAGVRHAVCCDSPLPTQGSHNLTVPARVPSKYAALKEVPCRAVHARLLLLHHFSELVLSSWRLFSLCQTKVRCSAGIGSARDCTKFGMCM